LLRDDYYYRGLRFTIPRDLTTLVYRARLLWHGREVPERTLCTRHIPRDATILELGGCIGFISCIVNRHLSAPSRHVVIEAHPALIPYLHANRDANAARFAIHHAVIGRESIAAFFLRDPYALGSSMVRRSGREISVPALTVDAVQAAHGWRFDTLICDIEGGEADFFNDNKVLTEKLRAVVLEFHPHIIGERRCQEIRALLTAAGLARKEVIGDVEAWARPA